MEKWKGWKSAGQWIKDYWEKVNIPLTRQDFIYHPRSPRHITGIVDREKSS